MSLTEENIQVLNLVQAMIGAVSSNFRWVTLELTNSRAIQIRFVLAQEDTRDREEIEDISFLLATLQTRDIDIKVDVLVDRRPISDLELPGRVVFGRKE